MEEIWKNIKGYEDVYMISNFARIKSMKYKKERILKQSKNTNGYFYVNLSLKCKRNNFLVHRLVAEAFIPKIKNKNI